MSSFKKLPLEGRVEALLSCEDSEVSIVSEPLHSAEISMAGIEGDTHGGRNRPSCVRVKDLYEEGTEIANTRQFSIVSSEELAMISEGMGLDALQPGWLGANLEVSGIPHLTLLPPSTRLIFSSGASLIVDLENLPCIYPARVIDEHHPKKGMSFIKNAKNKRGVTAWVERPGKIAVGDSVAVHIPKQPAYPGI